MILHKKILVDINIPIEMLYSTDIYTLRKIQWVLDLLNFVPILARLDCFSHSITMEALTPVSVQTVRIHRIEQSPGFTVAFLPTPVSSSYWDSAAP